MKKLLFLFVFSVSLASMVTASVQPPLDGQGHALNTVDFVGAIPCIINQANQPSPASGAPIVCGSSSTITRSVVYGVIASSIPSTGFLVFRDTIPAGAGGILGVQSSTIAVVYSYEVNYSSTPWSIPGSHFIKFPVPLQFLKGIAVNTDATLGGSTTGWTILYRPIAATE